MGGKLARESCIWNMLVFGMTRYDLEQPIEENCDVNSKPLNEGNTIGIYNMREKGEVLGEKADFDWELNIVKSKRKRNVLKYMLIWGVAVLSFCYGMKLVISTFCCSMNSSPSTLPFIGSFLDESFINQEDSENKRAEIILVSNPYVPNPNYGNPVVSNLLLNHTFGSSWGKPAVVELTPPDIDFDKVVLTLNTSVSGVQYDRLANIFIDGVQIWRTSTIEPGRRSVFSSTKKDVSVYVKLFQKKSKLIFQLDNLLSGSLTGAFDVQLTANFYKSAEPIHSFEEHTDQETIHEIFDTSKPADKIFPLIDNSEQNKPSLAYLPSDKLSYQIPILPQNTTRLKLSILTSGNAAEEFWYANVLDKYRHYFSHPIEGHGPLRVVNVYFNGEKIATQSPQPIIFTGGLSPALWSAVVSSNAFDLPNIELDITGLLPFIWESQSIEDRILEIEITNAIDETSGPKSGISENWITSANILTFESDLVNHSSGEVISVDDDRKTDVIDFAVGGLLNQILKSKFKAHINSSLNFMLTDGSELKTIVEMSTVASSNNVQHIEDKHMLLTLAQTGSSTKDFKIVNIADDSVIHKYNTKLDYPLVLTKKENNITKGNGFFDIEYDINLVNVRSSRVKVNDRSIIENSSAQNGTSTYYISKSGNHGEAKLDTKFKMTVDSPSKYHSYKRKVESSNGVITSDKSYESSKKELSGSGINIHELTSLVNLLPGQIDTQLIV